MSSASSVLPSDLVSVEVAAQRVGAHPHTSLTRCTFPVLYPVLAPERGPEWQTHARRRNLGRVLREGPGSASVSSGSPDPVCGELAYGDSSQRRRRPSKPWKNRPDHPRK